MSQKKRKKLSTAQRRQVVARLYMQGKLQHEIGEEVQVTQSTVSRDLQAIREQWQEAAILDFNEAVNRELDRLDLYEKELWEAWERSKQPGGKTHTSVKGVTAKLSDYEITDEGIQHKGKRKHVPLETSTRKTSYARDGNPMFMRLLLQVSQQRTEILMLAIPDGEEDMGEADQFFEALTASANAAWSGVEDAQWEDVEEEENDDAGGNDDSNDSAGGSRFKLLGD